MGTVTLVIALSYFASVGPDPAEIILDEVQARIVEHHITKRRMVRSVADIGSKVDCSGVRAVLTRIQGTPLPGSTIRYSVSARYDNATHTFKTSVPMGNADRIWHVRRYKNGEAVPTDTNRRHLFALALSEYYEAHPNFRVKVSKSKLRGIGSYEALLLLGGKSWYDHDLTINGILTIHDRKYSRKYQYTLPHPFYNVPRVTSIPVARRRQ